jgi:chromosome segregation ATPase
VQQPDTRQKLIETGLLQAQHFTWQRAAKRVAQVLEQTAADLKRTQPTTQSPSRQAVFWNYFRTLQRDYQPLEVALNRTQRQLAQAERQLKRSQNQVQQMQQRLEDAKNQIQGMESSKFWRIRNLFFEIKQKLRSTPMP